MAYAITIGDHLYGYGDTLEAAREDFRQNILGATQRQKTAMRNRSVAVRLDDDEASEVAEMLAAPAIIWD
jgi:hypothetical protein